MTREELERETGVTARNIRFLIAEGLIPPPNGTGRGAWYTSEHVAMLKAYAVAKAEGVTSTSVTSVRMRMAADTRRDWKKTGVDDWLTIEVDMNHVRKVGVEHVLEKTRRTLEALLKRDNI